MSIHEKWSKFAYKYTNIFFYVQRRQLFTKLQQMAVLSALKNFQLWVHRLAQEMCVWKPLLTLPSRMATLKFLDFWVRPFIIIKHVSNVHVYLNQIYMYTLSVCAYGYIRSYQNMIMKTSNLPFYLFGMFLLNWMDMSKLHLQQSPSCLLIQSS